MHDGSPCVHMYVMESLGAFLMDLGAHHVGNGVPLHTDEGTPVYTHGTGSCMYT